MRVKLLIDSSGWQPINNSGMPPWQSVTSDELKIQAIHLRETFPNLNDVDAVRHFFRRLVGERKGALISCDPVATAETPMVRVVSKYPAGRGYAVAYVAALAFVLDDFLVELLITGSEDGITGVREAMVMRDLMQTAGESEQQQLAKGVTPIEWKFERYEPGTRKDWAYLLSDDEKYDSAYPNHPLTRVRRWLRRIERTFRVIRVEPTIEANPPAAKLAAGQGGLWGKLRERLGHNEMTSLNLKSLPDSGSDREQHKMKIDIQMVPVKPMGYEELIRELGPEVAADAIMGEAMKRVPANFPALDVRQKMYRDQRDAALKKIMEQEATLNSIREAAKKLLSEITPEDTKLILARHRAGGGWHIAQEGHSQALAMFSGMAFFDDYVECKKLECDPSAISIRELFDRLSEWKGLGIDSVSIDRCPRCMDVRQVFGLNAVNTEADLLQMYAHMVAGQKFLVDEKLQTSLKESNSDKRLQGLKHVVEHMDPGNATAHLEIARLAVASGDTKLFEQCSSRLARYAPEQVASLPAMPK